MKHESRGDIGLCEKGGGLKLQRQGLRTGISHKTLEERTTQVWL